MGSSGSTNRSTALSAKTGATGNAQNLTQLGENASGNSQSLYNLLWGAPSGPSTTATPYTNWAANGSTTGAGGPGGSGSSSSTGGALTNFLNPANLNVTKPTGPFALQNTQENQNAETAGNQEATAIKQNAANAGFGANSPAGFTQDQLRQNANNTSNQIGQNFANNAMNSYNAANNDFWNAAQLANGTSNTQGSQALAGNEGAGGIYNNIYGTASKQPGGGGGANATTNALGMASNAAQGAVGAKG